MKTKSVTIFEGPDGSGKTFLAKAFADKIGAHYVHFPAVPNMTEISRIYIEAAMPALLGLQDVVFDRSWMSEVPYGVAFRNSLDRVGSHNRRCLERLFMRCATVVVKCLPDFEVCARTFRSRRKDEMLNNETQLKIVYDQYAQLKTGLPTVQFDYTKSSFEPIISRINSIRPMPHDVDSKTVGNILTPWIVIVADSLTERDNVNCFTQYPFVHLSNGLARVPWRIASHCFERWGIPEMDILWIDSSLAKSILEIVPTSVMQTARILYSGDAAAEGLYESKVQAYDMSSQSSLDLYNYIRYIRGPQ
jgi:thymidylate kinase